MSASTQPQMDGIALYNAGRYADAVRYFEDIVAKEEDGPTENIFLAYSYASLGKSEAAVRQLRTALARGGKTDTLLEALAKILRETSSLKTLRGEKAGLGESHRAQVLMGGMCLEEGRLAEAERHLNDALALEKKSARAYFLLGRVYDRKGDTAQAEVQFKKALRLANDSIELLLEYGEFCLSCGKNAEAEKVLLRAHALDSHSIRGHSLLGRVLESEGRDEEAHKEYQKALAIDPALPETVLLICQFYTARGRSKDAESILRNSVDRLSLANASNTPAVSKKAWSEEAQIFFKLAWIQYGHGEYAAMRKTFRGYLDRESADFPKRFLARVALEEYPEAVREAEKALECEEGRIDDRLFHPWVDDWFPPRSESFYSEQMDKIDVLAEKDETVAWHCYFRGILLSLLRRSRESLGMFDRIARFGESYGWMRYAAGLKRLENGAFDCAIEDFNAALTSRPGMWMVRCHLAEAFLCLGKTKSAFAAFDDAESHAGKYYVQEVRAWRGEALLWWGMYADAIKELTRAIEGGSEFAYTWRGAAYMLTEEYELAKKDLNRAAASGTSDAEIYLWRGELNRRLGNMKEALLDLDKALRFGGGAWALVNRMLVRFAEGDFKALWVDFEALPDNLFDFREEEGRGAALRNLDAKKAAALLEDALRAACGVRRVEPYAAAVWRSRRIWDTGE